MQVDGVDGLAWLIKKGLHPPYLVFDSHKPCESVIWIFLLQNLDMQMIFHHFKTIFPTKLSIWENLIIMIPNKIINMRKFNNNDPQSASFISPGGKINIYIILVNDVIHQWPNLRYLYLWSHLYSISTKNNDKYYVMDIIIILQSK